MALQCVLYRMLTDDLKKHFYSFLGLDIADSANHKNKGRIPYKMETALRIRFSKIKLYLITKIGVLEWKIIRRAMLGLNKRAKTFRL